MKQTFVYILFVLFFNVSVQDLYGQKGFLFFEKIESSSGENWHSPVLKKAWYSDSPRTQIDYYTTYKDHPSLLISSTKEKNNNVYFHFSNRDIVGEKIVFKGRYKYQDAQDARVSFSTTLNTFLRTLLTEKQDIICRGNEGWKTFSVEMPLERTEDFFFRIVSSGNIKLWIADCQVEVDGQSFDIMVNPTARADKDFEFIEKSGISIYNRTRQTLDNLEVLGRVWGFLKYFHPQVINGNYNWDFELFRVLPKIAGAKDKKERNWLISKWIDKYGEIKEIENYTVRDSMKYHRFACLNWLEDSLLFDRELSDKLVRIKNAKRNGVFNYYLVPLSWKEEVEFTREKPYPSITWNDQGYRILTLYRLWNAIEYCFPYTNYTDHKWNALLPKYLPGFIEAASEESLDLSIQELCSEINDSHGNIYFAKQESPMRGLPVSLTQTVDGKLVVESTRLKEISRGAVILGVKGKSMSDIIEYYRPRIPASNERGLLRNVAQRLFLTTEPTTEVTFEYKKEKYDSIKVPTQTYTRDAHEERKKPEDYATELKDIIYLDLGEISAEELEQKMQEGNKSKGLILDLRKYPRGYTKDILEKYLYPKPTEYMWFSMNSKRYPGNFFLDIRGEAGLNKNPHYFKGKIAILVNEYTQSLGELSAIAYRVAPRSSVIGTQTAGANGHIGYLFLPRGIRFAYTMAGAFYPDWGRNQRVGVKIDIPVDQKIEDVEMGEDPWIKKAIEYINE